MINRSLYVWDKWQAWWDLDSRSLLRKTVESAYG